MGDEWFGDREHEFWSVKGHTVYFDVRLGHGVRQQRHFRCTCGLAAYGYDSHVKPILAAHKREVKGIR